MHRLALVLFTVIGLVAVPSAAAWTWPLGGPVLRPYSLGPDPYAAGQHRGIDVSGVSAEQVLAPASGTVSFAGTVPTHGRTITIQTADGYAVSLTHLGEIGVAKGEAVTEGARVGVAGASGESEWPTPYVHLGVRVAATADGYVDPATLLPPRAVLSAPEHVTPTPAAPTPAAPAPAAPVPVAPEPAEVTPQPSAASDPAVVAAPVAHPSVQAPVASPVREQLDVRPASAAPPVAAATVPSPDTDLVSDAHAVNASRLGRSVAPSVGLVGVAVGRSSALAGTSRSGPVSSGASSVPLTTAHAAASGRPSAPPAESARPAPRRAVATAARPAVERPPVVPAGSRLSVDRDAPGSARRVATPSVNDPVLRRVVALLLHDAPGGRFPAAAARAPVVLDGTGVEDPWALPSGPVLAGGVGAACAAALAVAWGLRRRQKPARMMTGDVCAPEDTRGSGMAVCERPTPHRSCGGLRRPVRHLRALSPVARERRSHGQRHRRARDADHGRRGSRRPLST